ncbi:twin-arginine translocation pathway signal protein [Novosphingobium indicum]|uniref:twin-arginine translocation pathway signal protein n=1 Tax=Novosphingobium indicum TaxID=462949 RepID=UPI00166ADC0C|nr:twin-arginine translocation pathway signal protein [Novosphingobium indicum]
MRNLRITGAALALTMAMVAGSPVMAGDDPAPAEQGHAAEASPFVPADFEVPTLVEAESFKLVPLGPDLVKIDFDAYMSSIEHLQKTFSRSTSWPHEGISDADAMKDMENEQARFQKRSSFAYAVLPPDGLRERGCIYVYPSNVDGYDAVVRMWVTKAEYDAGFEDELYNFATNWIETEWPFEKVAYPGHSVDWETWDALVEAGKAGEAAPEDEG